jgi:hypothetical protein
MTAVNVLLLIHKDEFNLAAVIYCLTRIIQQEIKLINIFHMEASSIYIYKIVLHFLGK